MITNPRSNMHKNKKKTNINEIPFNKGINISNISNN